MTTDIISDNPFLTGLLISCCQDKQIDVTLTFRGKLVALQPINLAYTAELIALVTLAGPASTAIAAELTGMVSEQLGTAKPSSEEVH